MIKFIPDAALPTLDTLTNTNERDITFRIAIIIVIWGVKTGISNESERTEISQWFSFIDILNMNFDTVSTSPKLFSWKNWDKDGQFKISNESRKGWSKNNDTYVTPLKNKTIVLWTFEGLYLHYYV